MIIDLNDIKLFLSIAATDDSEDSAIASLIPMAQAEAESYCDRKFDLAMRTEYYATNLQTTLQLRNYPIVQSGVYSLVIYDDLNLSWTSDTLLAAEQYQVDEEWGRVVLVGQYFSVSINPAIKNIKVQYGAGYDDNNPAPEDLKLAILKLLTSEYKKADTYLNAVENTVKEKGKAVDLREEAYEMLDRHKRFR